MPTLDWIGKKKVVNHHLDVPFKVLNKQYTFSADGKAQDSENKIIHGDNLEALKALLPEYEGKIKCIYIDPPYNTGNENWVYNDNVNDPRIKKWLGEVVGQEGEDLTRHDKWLCMMYPRLKLLHKLLSDDGAIFISIDDCEYTNLKLICDEIFGISCFVANTVWQNSIQPKGYLGSFSIQHNYTLVYSKNSEYIVGNLERTAEHNKAYKNPDNDPRGPWRSGDVRNALYRPNLIYEIISPSGKKISPPSENGWRWSKETMAEKIRTGEIIFNKDETGIIRKIYLDTVDGRAPESIWFGEDVGTTREATTEMKDIFGGKTPFDTPKPTRLIERILQIASEKDSIILDSFSGSGTTAHAVLNMNKRDDGNRKFILIEMMDYAESITAERVKRVIKGYGSDKDKVEGLGGDFSFYELGEPLLVNGLLNEKVDVSNIREYIWFTETHLKLFESQKIDNEYFLGKNHEVGYWFYYKKNEETCLNYDFLSTMKTKADQYIIYADVCRLPASFLKEHNIVFKKIPREIQKF
ncbi:site-specific DNA-methyltransferase [Treponema sp.]|uniref:site-specific DNA-methyltransferase n=1 Tax=Treponema sp. TaxID=166 RepID=UPI00298DC680|nr:site-specific DNA-methyltransferase [Treponema sp.]